MSKMKKTSATIGLAAAAVAALTVVIAGTANADEPCVPSDGTPASFTGWKLDHWTGWQHEPGAPVDPDGSSDQTDPANLTMVGDPETVKDVTQEATEDTTVIHQQHYSWTGGHLDADTPPTEKAPGPDWQANTESEPHAKGNGSKEVTWVNDSLHYTANSNGHAAWFYLGTTTETIPGQSEVSHLDYRYPVLVRTYTAATDPVVCEDPTDPTDPTDPATPTVPPVTPVTPATTPAEQPAVDAAVEAESAHLPSASNANGPSAQQANGAPQHVRQPEAVLPTAIDAGL